MTTSNWRSGTSRLLRLGFAAALLCGIVAIHWVLWLLKRARLSWFAAWCALLGAIALAVG